MKLDERGFPTKPILPHSKAHEWAVDNIAPKDWWEFWGSQARLARRKARQWAVVAIIFGMISVASFASFLISLIGKLS